MTTGHDTALDVVMADRHKLQDENAELLKLVKQQEEAIESLRKPPDYHLCEREDKTHIWRPYPRVLCSLCKPPTEDIHVGNVLEEINELQKEKDALAYQLKRIADVIKPPVDDEPPF